MRTSVCFLVLLYLPICLYAQREEADPYQEAIKAGAKYLKEIHAPGGGYRGGSHGVGTACLGGLALLEAGESIDSPELVNISNFVRNQALSTTGTYEVALTIMFLDRMGTPADVPLLQFMGIRLLSGQNRDGSWSYNCGLTLNPNEERRLRGVLVREARLVAAPVAPPKVTSPMPEKPKPVPRDDLPKDPSDPIKPKENPVRPKVEPKKADPPKTETPKESFPKLHEEAARYARILTENNNNGLFGLGGDHSNTQFATVALWCARRNGVPVDNAIALLDRYYRACQNNNGSWGYTARGGESPAMTCAGLIALGLGYGLKEAAMRNRPDAGKKGAPDLGIDKDKALEAGLKYLGTAINRDAQQDDRVIKGKKRFRLNDSNENLYLLWSIERVGVLLGLNTIGNIDWYAWGADALVASQRRDGSWTSTFHGGAEPDVSTPLAVLFLSRANLAGDLSRSLRGQVKDPGTATLVGGGDISKLLPSGGKTDPTNSSTKNDPVKTDPRTDPKTDPKADPSRPNPVSPVTRPDEDYLKKVDRLVLAVKAGRGDDMGELLNRYAETKGAEYTEALARLAAQFTGASQTQAREALARRLTRMTVGTLFEMLRDSDPEIRRAAALACGSKSDKILVPELIRLLGDSDPQIVQNARQSLKVLTKVDFGPEPTANSTERTKALLAWRQWWDKNK